MFETEEDIGVASAKLTQIVSVWPGRDQYIDHSAAYQAAQPFVLFEALQLQPIPHVLYLAHSSLLAFAGKAHLEVAFDLAQGASSPLDVMWEFGTAKSGASSSRSSLLAWKRQKRAMTARSASREMDLVRLDAEAGQTAPTTVNGVQSLWIRGRLDQPLPPNPALLLPLAETIRVRTLIDQGLELKVGVTFADRIVSALKVVDESGQDLTGLVTVRLTQADDPSVVLDSTNNVQSWQFTTGKTYQVVATYQTDPATQGMTGTAFVMYSLENSTALVTIVLKVLGSASR